MFDESWVGMIGQVLGDFGERISNIRIRAWVIDDVRDVEIFLLVNGTKVSVKDFFIFSDILKREYLWGWFELGRFKSSKDECDVY